MLPAGLAVLIGVATLAFGAVYPWAYVPMYAVAAGLGLAGLVRTRGLPAGTPAMAAALALVALAIALQLVPLPEWLLDAVSPHTTEILRQYSLTFANHPGPHPLSIDPAATALAHGAFVALSLYAVGLPGLFSPRHARALPRYLIIFAVPLAIISIYLREHNNGLVYGLWQPVEGTAANGFGPFVNRNHYAGWMLMTLGLSFGVLCARAESAAAHVRGDLHRRFLWLSSPEASQLGIGLIGVFVMAISLVWTLSRSGIIAFAAALALFALAVARRLGARRPIGLGIVAGLSALLLVSLAWRGAGDVWRWFGDTTDLVGRFAVWRDAWRVVRDFPAAGTGVNTFGAAMNFYQRHLTEFAMTRAHNDYLQVLAEGGLLVSVPALAAAAVLTVAVLRRLRESRERGSDYWPRVGAAIGLAAMAVQEAAEFSLHIPANALVFATLVALVFAPAARAPRQRPDPEPS